MRMAYTEAEERLLRSLAEVADSKGIPVLSFCKAIAPLLNRTPHALLVHISKMRQKTQTEAAPAQKVEAARPLPEPEPAPQCPPSEGAAPRLGEPVEADIPFFLDEDVLVEPDLGAIIDVEVKAVRPYGAIVQDIKTSWRGLLHISEIAYRYIDNIWDYVKEGQRLKVVVIKSPDGRKACSLKRLPYALRGEDVAERDPKSACKG